MDRRTFLLGALGAAAAATAGGVILEQVSDGSDRPRRETRKGGDARTYGETVLRRQGAESDAPNVLMISLDDCNDWLGFLNNHPGTRTPNLDALAAGSLVFTQAYCVAPMCLPSRTAMLFGVPPHETGVYNHSDESYANYARVLETPSIIDDLWAAGYDAICAGKIFHDGQGPRWTEYRDTRQYVSNYARDQENITPEQYDPDWVSPYDNQRIGRGERYLPSQVDFGPSGKTADADPDGLAAAWLDDHFAAPHERPFFLGLGLSNPHEPWRVPQEYLDMHPLEGIVVPDFGRADLDDLSAYARDEIIDAQQGIFAKLQTAGIWEEAVQAYQASISYADSRVGVVLDALASSPYADNTIVVVWSDHGYHLGEKMHFEKFTLWEAATHVPFLLRVPGRFDSHREFAKPVSLIDIAPTVAELCGAEVHTPQRAESLLPLIDEPDLADARPPIMTWLEGNHAVRRGQWRYIRYRTGDTELYDRSVDPDELTNLAADPQYAAIVAELDPFLPDG